MIRREQDIERDDSSRRLEIWKCDDEGYEVFGDRCYSLKRSSTMTYKNAKDLCESEGATLITIKSQEVNDFLRDLIYSDTDVYWLGATDIASEGTFQWPDGSQVSASWTNWNSGEPNDWGGEEDCTEFFKYAKWNDINCRSADLFPACEKAAEQGTLSPTPSPTEPQRYDDSEDESNIHGNVNPILIERTDDNGIDYSYFLSVFHTVSEEDELNYASYAFTFCPQAPFQISAVSKNRIPLQTGSATCGGRSPFGFVSGLSTEACSEEDPSQCLVMTYGVCDHESRVAYVKLNEFEQTLTKIRDC